MVQFNAQSNNSLNASADSGAFICEAGVVIMVRRAALIRALGCCAKKNLKLQLACCVTTLRVVHHDIAQARLVNCESCLRSRNLKPGALSNHRQPNNSLNASADSELLMLDLRVIAASRAALIRALGCCA